MAAKSDRFRSYGIGPVTIGLLTIALLSFTASFQPRVGLFFDSILGTSNDLSLQQAAKSRRLLEEKFSSALIDAVISIAQSYYVDSERVENSKIIEGAIKSLAFAIPESQLDESTNTWTLKVKGLGVSISKNQTMSYDEVVKNLKTLVEFCDKVDLVDLVTPASSIMLGAEKSATTLVLNAVLSSLDAHSSLMSPDGYKDLRQGTDGSFGGLGVLVSIKDYQLTVLKPMPRSPALRAGLKRNDKILAIDGFSTFGLSLDQLVSHMRGEPGSTAKLAILRPDALLPVEISVPREVIEVDSVEAKPIHKGNLHYLHLVVDSFSARTGREVAQAIRSFKHSYPLAGVVLDLRSNPGGLLDQAIEVSDVFLQEGLIVSTRGRRDEVERASAGIDELNFPLVVLMNEDSASASEIVAGALQDNGRAIVVGQPSFGKGSVQTLFELPAERALKITIARYLTPLGRSIQNVGIMPDVWVQPVRVKPENKNLFGMYRYRSEAFLPNHLSPVAYQPDDAALPMVKGFYMRRTESQDSGDSAMDFELEIAEAIINKSNLVYGADLPKSAQRSSHILMLGMEDIHKTIQQRNDDTAQWLNKNFHVVWGDGSSPKDTPITLQVNQELLDVTAGKTTQIPWKIKNQGKLVAHHVSVFVQSPISGIETHEVIVGDVPAGETVEGFISLQVPGDLSPGVHRLMAGLAVDAVALNQSIKEIGIRLQFNQFAQITAASTFEDGLRSTTSGVLDPDEAAVLKIRLSNPSDVDLNDIRFELFNLAGSQIKVGQPKFDFTSLAAHESRDVFVPLLATKRLASGVQMLGYVVKSPNLNNAVAKIAEFTTTGTSTSHAVGLGH